MNAARSKSNLSGGQQLVINGVLVDALPGDTVAETFVQRQQAALAALPDELAALPAAGVPLVGWELKGRAALTSLTAASQARLGVAARVAPEFTAAGLDSLVDELAAAEQGVIMVMGKGGVGKTTIATAIALGLARLGHDVQLSTTDPAGRIPELPSDQRALSLTVSRIDPVAEVQRYTAEKLRRAAQQTEEQRELLREDLRSPCTEELAVFQAFSRLLGRGRHSFVVVDTAPTGHTLLLLDRTGAYHRDIVRTLPGKHGKVTTPLMRLQDEEFTSVLIVTLAEATPVQEAAQLQDDLRRAGIEPYGWVVNATLSGSGPRDPLLERRAALEHDHLRHVRDRLARRLWLVAWSPSLSA